MNWLAHLHLSEPSPAFRLGNLLPDMPGAPELAALPEEFQRGVKCHHRIDAFTDAHPSFRQSVARLSPRFRRFGGIIVDVLKTHVAGGDQSRDGDGMTTKEPGTTDAATRRTANVPVRSKGEWHGV